MHLLLLLLLDLDLFTIYLVIVFTTTRPIFTIFSFTLVIYRFGYVKSPAAINVRKRYLIVKALIELYCHMFVSNIIDK